MHFTKLAIVFIAVVALTISCQQPHEPGKNSAGKDTIADAKQSATDRVAPTDSGYAAVNGLRLYYEVYGQGKPIVLLHGSFMNIPANWSNIIPMLAKSRKVIVAEMQAHGRTKDISREFSYESMADDVSGLLKHLAIDSADILGYSPSNFLTYVSIKNSKNLPAIIYCDSQQG